MRRFEIIVESLEDIPYLIAKWDLRKSVSKMDYGVDVFGNEYYFYLKGKKNETTTQEHTNTVL